MTLFAALVVKAEVVDIFPRDARARLLLLDEWQAHYETGRDSTSL